MQEKYQIVMFGYSPHIPKRLKRVLWEYHSQPTALAEQQWAEAAERLSMRQNDLNIYFNKAVIRRRGEIRLGRISIGYWDEIKKIWPPEARVAEPEVDLMTV